MKTLVRLTLTILFLASALTIGCSDVGFRSIPKLSCDDVSRDQDTQCFVGDNTVSISFTFRVGEVDILFVDDNSGSMFIEQQKMANAFPNFLNKIANLLFRIAIITTDVSASPGNTVPKAANGMGAYQDGKFLEFTLDDVNRTKSGLKMIDYNTANVQSLFRGTIKRQESIDCDNAGFATAACPSTDERGIYAANLAVERGELNFFRPGAHLAIVVLSDEDERSQGGTTTGSLPLEIKDRPETLVSNLKNLYPTKSVKVHSIVTNDATCLAQQRQFSPNGIHPTLGFIGAQYIRLSNPDSALRSLGNLLTGTVGSICSNDYGAQLSNIGQDVSNNTFNSPKGLACNPDLATIKIVTSPAGFENQIVYAIDSQNRVTFDNVPVGVEVTFSYDCPRF